MRILIGCEESGVVRRAFRERGHDAWSCDFEPARDGSPYHLQCDVLSVLDQGWDMALFYPPCTHLAVSGASSFAAKRVDGRQQAAIDFFMALANAPIKRICIENPVCIMSSVWRKPDQIIHPWMFGHMEQKTTCLWLKNLHPLESTKSVYFWMMRLPKHRRERLHYMGPSRTRARDRSETFKGIAEAKADQWGDYLPPKRIKKPSPSVN